MSVVVSATTIARAGGLWRRRTPKLHPRLSEFRTVGQGLGASPIPTCPLRPDTDWLVPRRPNKYTRARGTRTSPIPLCLFSPTTFSVRSRLSGTPPRPLPILRTGVHVSRPLCLSPVACCLFARPETVGPASREKHRATTRPRRDVPPSLFVKDNIVQRGASGGNQRRNFGMLASSPG